MSLRSERTESSLADGLRPLPFSPQVWERVATAMQLSGQHRRIVELLLRGKKCKQIGPALEISGSTVETYLKRIYQRHGVADHTDLLLHIMAVSQRVVSDGT